MTKKLLRLQKERNSTITHFTKAVWLDDILKSGTLELEGYNSTNKLMAMQYDLIGQWLWFTEESDCKCITALMSLETTGFTFKAGTIGAAPWKNVRKRIMRRSNKSKLFVKALEAAAEQTGDNWKKWWVAKNPVDINKALNISEITSKQKQLAA